ncbi:energy transducer TonB [Paraburkholderia megapolitana]|uniref:energy transducer TonB n=1 Tax=Paraburkholderia megapolitana TaxID=420953 RepID=UPI0038BD615C
MKSRYISVISLLALGLAGYVPTGHCASDVSSFAGLYSSAHTVTINGVRTPTNGYIEIDRDGRIAAFEQDGEGPISVGSGCYRPAVGTATNAGLQGRILTPGVSPRGDAVYQTLAGDGDTFGILVEPAASGEMRWFFHSGRGNSTVTINGKKNVVNSENQSSYSISGPALASPTPEQLRNMLCHADAVDPVHVKPDLVFHAPRPGADAIQTRQDATVTAGNPVAASSVRQATPMANGVNPSPLAATRPTATSTVSDYAARVQLRVRPNIVWDGTAVHGETVIEVHCTSSGKLESVKIVRSSGDGRWDSAALRAVSQSDPMPLDENGKAPQSFSITMRPGI